jgi:phosphoglycerate kinase
MSKLSIRDLDLTNKRVFIRVDFNVPLALEATGVRILDDTRIRETIPTIEYALRRKARVILAAHLGRPKGKPVDAMSLRPVVARLRMLLDHVLDTDENVAFAPDCVGPVAQEMANNLEPGQTLLLENLRFHPGEEGSRISCHNQPLAC